MNKRLNFVCSILALLCCISMYMPVVAPRFPANQYYAPAGSFESRYFFTGEYYLAREYWSVTKFAFSSSIVLRVVVSLTQALLLLWAWMSVRGEAGKQGLMIAILCLVVTAGTLVWMIATGWSCRWGVLAIMALDLAAAVVTAAKAK